MAGTKEVPSPVVVDASVPHSGTDLGPTPFPYPSNPGEPPWAVIPVPQHVSTSAWQMSYYDPTNTEDASVFAKRPSGPVDIETGKLTGEGFHPGHHWRQV